MQNVLCCVDVSVVACTAAWTHPVSDAQGPGRKVKLVFTAVNISAVEAAFTGWGKLIDLKDTSVVPLALVLYVQQQIAKGGIRQGVTQVLVPDHVLDA